MTQTAVEWRHFRAPRVFSSVTFVNNSKAARSGNAAPDAGYAAVDAITALVIIAMTVSLSLVGLRSAKQMADMGSELRQAHSLLAYLLDVPETSAFPMRGKNVRFDWSLEREPTDATRPVAICRRTASLHSKITTRDYRIVALEPCTPEEAL